MIDVVTNAFGGSALVRAAVEGQVPHEWYSTVPATTEEWSHEMRRVAADWPVGEWLVALAAAFNASGNARARLERVARDGGVVITTGQQPGLFGGPIYTWSKALTALALADELEARTGIPVAPVFWAATDDADFAEASTTAVVVDGEVRVLRMADDTAGRPMAETLLGDVAPHFATLADAAGSILDPRPLESVRHAYMEGGSDPGPYTVGGAYVRLLREMFEPLGIAVLDASHPAVRAAGATTVRTALRLATPVRDALAERTKAIEAQGFRAQVQPVPNLSLAFRMDGESRKRVALKDAAAAAADAPDSSIGPNVLLRPIVERAILPTVTYVAGPGEYAYFAQVSAVANALQMVVPRVVPRWSGTLVEPHVREVLASLNATLDDFRDPHALEGRVAREELPVEVRGALDGLRTAVRTNGEAVASSALPLETVPKIVAGFEAQIGYRIDRLERRFAAAVKRSGNARLRAVSAARASLFPNGTPQERLLNIVPFCSRYGTVVIDAMLRAARVHATSLVESSRGELVGRG